MNQFIKEVMSVGEMASGVKLTVPVYSFKAQQQAPAPRVYIQANMHGAEVQGNAVIFQLLELLQYCDLNANITLVPYANPVGCNHKNGEYTLGRFDPITGVNWNRMYHFNEQIVNDFAQHHAEASDEQIKSKFEQLLVNEIDKKLEHNIWGITTGQRIAYQLQRLAHQADIVLDLHTGPISSKHLYCPEYAKESAQFFDIEHTILIDNAFDGAMDEATFCPWWSLQKAMHSLGRECSMGQGAFKRESFTVELGSQEQIDLEVAKEDAKSILSYLSYQGAITNQEYKPQKMIRFACYLKDYKALYSPMGGMVDYLAEFGQPIAAGEPLARILRMDNYGDGEALHYVAVDQAAIPILHFASASVNQGTELYKMFTNYFTL
jgi:hypothetical protein